MTFQEEMEVILLEMSKKIEYERFLMGMGKYEFAKMLGIQYHTYKSFIERSRMTTPKTGSVILKFLIERRVNMGDIEKQSELLNDLMKKEMSRKNA